MEEESTLSLGTSHRALVVELFERIVPDGPDGGTLLCVRPNLIFRHALPRRVGLSLFLAFAWRLSNSRGSCRAVLP
jgi:hypothetical protein